ncbi:DNA gyrase/topoisomerase IV subunit A [Rubritalea marina]|uniref:DNA gyrase/topoisomerase IV subunit A n=1 Tax=Rubritalea marina TaxID=361055 RepID=UPI00037E7DA9|nr:DNA gyrase/topoisomerase IV subunit A [Rubritalea marina]
MSEEELQEVSLRGMYADYFLDYASYVILERAVPYVEDGLKPVQRRILHSLNELDDGRYNKVANVVGNTMKYHPHGDASIGDAMVGLGQKDLLIDTQGNWGNVLTGDRAAAPRYIEARLTPFAKDITFNPKTTKWTPSYDGRNQEPVCLPVKFPLLLAQGVEGIAVGLACKILPHNFNELIEASIAVLRKQEVDILPDFLTGGIMDASDYRDGLRGGKVRVRARIEVDSKKLLRITEVPYGTTTGGLMDNIVAANEKGKIKISKVVDNTAAHAEILVLLPAGSEPEVVRDALYAFTDCEVSISPNSCVIIDGKPQFMGVNDILRFSAEHTKDLLQQELEIRLGELNDKWHFSSLEKIFIENEIYLKMKDCSSMEEVIQVIDQGLEPFKNLLQREVVEEDITKLSKLPFLRMTRFDSAKADEALRALEEAIEEVERHLRNLTRYTISYYKNLQKKYGKGRERMTEISSFEKVDRTQVVVANETLFVDRKNGFAGYGLKKEEALEKCSELDDIIVIANDGTMKVMKVAEKLFVGKRPQHIAVFRKDEDKIYSIIYREGREGPLRAKRFRIGGVTRDKEYPLCTETKGTRIMYFAIHEDEKVSSDNEVLVHLKAQLRLRNLARTFKFEDIAIKGRAVRGNIVTKHAVDRIVRAPKNPELDLGEA